MKEPSSPSLCFGHSLSEGGRERGQKVEQLVFDEVHPLSL